jgi:hypothetical protein
MSLRLVALPVPADRLSAAASLLPLADPDAHRLRHGPAVRLRDGWPVLHGLLTHGDGPEARHFLVRGGQPVGDRARAFRSAEVPALCEAVEGVPASDPAARFEASEASASGVWFSTAPTEGRVGIEVVREWLAEVQVLLRAAADEGLGVLIVSRPDPIGLELHVASDPAIARYAEQPALLEAHLAPDPALPPEAVVLRGWFALHVALELVGGTEPEDEARERARRFLVDGGTLVDEALQLRTFPPAEVREIAALLAGFDPAEVLTPDVLAGAGLEMDEVDALTADRPALVEALRAAGDRGMGLVTLLV